MSTGPKRVSSTPSNHEIPSRHACVAEWSLPRNRGGGDRRNRRRDRGRRHGGAALLRRFTLKNGDELRAVGQPRSQLTSDRARANGYALRQRPPHRLSHLAAQTARQPTPLLVVFPSGFPVRGEPAGDPEAQIFADLGFAVVRLNHRSDGGVSAEDVTPLRGQWIAFWWTTDGRPSSGSRREIRTACLIVPATRRIYRRMKTPICRQRSCARNWRPSWRDLRPPRDCGGDGLLTASPI